MKQQNEEQMKKTMKKKVGQKLENDQKRQKQLEKQQNIMKTHERKMKKRKWGDNYSQSNDQAWLFILAAMIFCAGSVAWAFVS